MRTPRVSKIRARSGFTLVEMLTLVAIIGMLALIAQPNYATAEDQARNTAMVGNVRAVSIALEQYAADHKAKYPATIVDPTFLAGNYLAGSRLPIAPWYENPQVQAVQYAAPYDFDPSDWTYITYAASLGGGPQGWLQDAQLCDPPYHNNDVGVLRYNYYPDAGVYQLFGQGRRGDERVILNPLTNKGQ